ncbi:uncharacterized protein METZ01_LOCUS184804 [marine metagenome]|uniref:Uncharacterized protein n=1 Tax=marine metagenome TaxID=408172 RepID=A0A382D0I5_9ZZZZ
MIKSITFIIFDYIIDEIQEINDTTYNLIYEYKQTKSFILNRTDIKKNYYEISNKFCLKFFKQNSENMFKILYIAKKKYRNNIKFYFKTYFWIYFKQIIYILKNGVSGKDRIEVMKVFFKLFHENKVILNELNYQGIIKQTISKMQELLRQKDTSNDIKFKEQLESYLITN